MSLIRSKQRVEKTWENLLETRRSCMIPPTEGRRSPIYDVLATTTWSFSSLSSLAFFVRVRDGFSFFFFFFSRRAFFKRGRFHAKRFPPYPMVDDGNIVVLNGQVRWLAQLEDIDLLNYLIMLLPCRYKQLFGNVTCVFHRLMDTFMHSLDIGYDLDYGIKIESIEYILPCILPRGDLVQISKNNLREFCKNIELHE